MAFSVSNSGQAPGYYPASPQGNSASYLQEFGVDPNSSAANFLNGPMANFETRRSALGNQVDLALQEAQAWQKANGKGGATTQAGSGQAAQAQQAPAQQKDASQGKNGFFDCVGGFFKGLVKPVVETVKFATSGPAQLAATAGLVALGFTPVGAALGGVFLALGALTGGYKILEGLAKIANGETAKGFESFGEATFAGLGIGAASKVTNINAADAIKGANALAGNPTDEIASVATTIQSSGNPFASVKEGVKAAGIYLKHPKEAIATQMQRDHLNFLKESAKVTLTDPELTSIQKARIIGDNAIFQGTAIPSTSLKSGTPWIGQYTNSEGASD